MGGVLNLPDDMQENNLCLELKVETTQAMKTIWELKIKQLICKSPFRETRSRIN